LAKQSYYLNTFDKVKNDSKKTWATIRQVMSNGVTKNISTSPDKIRCEDNTTTSDPPKMAEVFNKFFTGIGPSLASSINSTNIRHFTEYLPNHNPLAFKFENVTSQQVLSTIKQIEGKSSSGPDQISSKILKLCSPHISDSLTLIVNQCLHNGIFPESLKIAKVIPIFKQHDLDPEDNK
jgi:hypothetical protein